MHDHEMTDMMNWLRSFVGVRDGSQNLALIIG